MGLRRKRANINYDSPARFRRFKQLPAEIQQQIFIEAMNMPYFHTAVVKRVDNRVAGTWSLSVVAAQKGSDKSGYRLYERMASVDPAAAAAMRYERQTRLEQLPFPKLKAHVDYERDLVILDFSECPKRTLGYFHPDNQILNPTGWAFDSNSVTMQLGKVQKLAIVWNEEHPPCQRSSNNFRCPEPSSSNHKPHKDLPMCPQELFGLINCFPKLRQFYFLVPQRKPKQQQPVEALTNTHHCEGLPPVLVVVS
ncbi:hypothetical protein VTH82DRAFT_6275 [Thermothelomyces myriococcoides]